MRFWTVIGFLLLATNALLVAIADTEFPPVPTRTRNLSEQALMLRRAAEIIEQDIQRQNVETQAAISNAVIRHDFSTDKRTVKVKTVSFMPNGTNLTMQVSFEIQEK